MTSALRDRVLAEMADDLLRHDERLHDFSVEVTVEGGVVHLAGAVRYPAQVRLLRELLGRLHGVLAVWDRVWVDGRPPVIAEVRAKTQPCSAATAAVPRCTDGAPVLVADVARGVPLADASVDRLFAVRAVEYARDILRLFDDCHRVLRPDGVLHVMAPYWRHVDAVADPTHVRPLDVQTIKGICLRPDAPRWFPLHVGCDGTTVFADLVPLADRDDPIDEAWLSRFFT